MTAGGAGWGELDESSSAGDISAPRNALYFVHWLSASASGSGGRCQSCLNIARASSVLTILYLNFASTLLYCSLPLPHQSLPVDAFFTQFDSNLIKPRAAIYSPRILSVVVT